MCLGMGISCVNVDEAKKTIKVYPPVSLTFATSASEDTSTASTWKGLCIKLRIKYSTALPIAKTLSLSSTTGLLYTDAGCSDTSITELAVAAGSNQSTVYYKTLSAAATDTITAQLSSTEASALTVTLEVPTADKYLGQASMTANSWLCNPVGTEFCEPWDISVESGKIYVADAWNNRVLVWNSLDPASGSEADMVLGQLDFTGQGAATNSQGMSYPVGVHVQGTKLFVSDINNNRVLVWNAIPTMNQQAASFALGQPDLDTGTSNTGGIGPNTLSAPGMLHSNGTVTVITDAMNNRVLVFPGVPSSNAGTPVILGQPNATTNASGTTRATFKDPYYSIVHEDKIIVSDYSNSRLLIWNSIPDDDNELPDTVLGQADFVSGAANRGGATAANTLREPGGVKVDAQGRLFVCDLKNERILIWNKIPTTNGAPADAVIGQVDLTTAAPGVSATQLNRPWSLSLYGNQLWISDYGNNRVVRMLVP